MYPVLLTSVTFTGRNRPLPICRLCRPKRLTTDVGNLYAIAQHVIICFPRGYYALLPLGRLALVGILYDSEPDAVKLRENALFY